jgi:hypothetical protein
MNSIRQKILLNLKNFSEFLMKGRREATIAAMLTAAVPFLGWLSLAIVALVTLRKGLRDGLFVLCWSLIPAIISAYLMTGTTIIAAESLISYALVWGLALLLRATASWRYVLEVSFGLALVIIIFFYWLIPDLNDIYAHYLMDVYRNAGTNADSYTDAQSFIDQLVYYLLGVQTTLYILHNLFALLVGRGLQATLFNPGGLSQDLKMIRLDWIPVLVAVICLVAGLKMSYAWALDTFPVLVVFFLIAGFSLIHYAVKQKIRFKGAIVLFYLLFILLLPFSVIPVILLAWGDTIWNIRRLL